jgi:hypothetical protein
VILGSGVILGSEFATADGMLSNGSLKGCSFDNQSTWESNIIDQSSINSNGDEVLIQGEAGIPASVQRLSSDSVLYPHR